MTAPQNIQTQNKTAPATQVVYDVDPSHSVVEFTVRHLMVTNVTGRFKTFRGTITLDKNDHALSSVEGDIETASIDTSAADRDAHLRGADFFDVENFPSITFKSTRVEPKDDSEAVVHGDLTIRGVTRPVALQVTHEGEAKDPWGNQRVGFTATTTISRKDFGLNWNVALETGGVLVSDKVKLTLGVSAIERKQA